MNEPLGILDIDGIIFPVEKAVLTRSKETGWDLEIVGQEQRIPRLNDELCAAYLQILGLPFAEAMDGGDVVPAGEAEIEWDKSDDERIDATYFTLFGEGFHLWTGRVSILELADGTWRLTLIGETDFPLEPTTENYPVSVETAVNLASP